MKIYLLLFCLTILTIILSSCKNYPTVAVESDPKQTLSPTSITDTAVFIQPVGVILTGKAITNDSAANYYFEYGFTSSYGIKTKMKYLGLAQTEILLYDTLYSLASDTVYHFRLVIVNADSIIAGADKIFRTDSSSIKYLPEIIIPSTVNGSPNPQDNFTSLMLYGLVKPHQLDTYCYFEYGYLPTYGNRSAKEVLVSRYSDSLSIAEEIKNLTPGKIYHWRVVAYNNAGIAVSDDHIITSPLPVSITIDPPSNITSSSITLNAHVFTGGRKASCYILYGPNANPLYTGRPTTRQDISSGTESVPFSVTLNNLNRGATYHWILMCEFTSPLTRNVFSNDTVFTVSSTAVNPKEFIFPDSVGTIWQYQYTYNYGYGPLGYHSDIVGIHTWSVLSKSNVGTISTIFIEDIRKDTVHNRGTYVSDTIFTTIDTVHFSVTRSLDTFVFSYPTKSLSSDFKTIPRFLDDTDSLTLVPSIYATADNGYCTYKSGVGLSGFYLNHGSISSSLESMSLIGLKKP